VIFDSRTAIESDFQMELQFTHVIDVLFEAMENFSVELHLQENIGLLLNDIAGNYIKLREVILRDNYRKILRESVKKFPESSILSTLVKNMKIYKKYLELLQAENVQLSKQEEQ